MNRRIFIQAPSINYNLLPGRYDPEEKLDDSHYNHGIGEERINEDTIMSCGNEIDNQNR